MTLLLADVVMSLVTIRSNKVDRLLNDVPLVLVEDGKLDEDRLKEARVSSDDILEHARELRGLERMDQIKYAVLERNGMVAVVPKEGVFVFNP